MAKILQIALILMLNLISVAMPAADLCQSVHLPQTKSSLTFKSYFHNFDGSVEETSLHLKTRAVGENYVQEQFFRMANYSETSFLPTMRDYLAPAVTRELKIGLGRFQESFNERMNREVKSFSEIDWYRLLGEVESGRVNFAMIQLKGAEIGNQTQIAGLLRVFDGSSYPSIFGGLRTSVLPCERFLKSKGLATQYFNQLRSQDFRLLEIGKYVVEKSILTTHQRKEVRNELLAWLKENYLDQQDQDKPSIFIVAVGSRAHKSVYQKVFGAVEIAKDEFGGELGAENSILRIDARTLREKITQLLAD